MADAQAPPPPLPPHVSLTDLFLQRNLLEASQQLRHMSDSQARAELLPAFTVVPGAPTAFLQCITVYASNTHITKFIGIIGVAVQCMQAVHELQIDAVGRQLAASVLPGLQDCRAGFLAAFVLAYQVEIKDLTAFVQHLMGRKPANAIQLMVEADQRHLLPVETVLHVALQKNLIHVADLFVKGNKEQQHLYVSMLLERNVADKIVKKRLSLFKLDVNAFPDYVVRKNRATLRFLMHSDQFQDALEFASTSPDLKAYACRHLLRQKGADHAITRQFVFRTGLGAQFMEVDISQEDGQSLPEQEQDVQPLDHCLSIVDLIGLENVVFVDTAEALSACAEHLLKQSVIGFDCEWKPTHGIATEVKNSPCALLQIASAQRAFVLDMLVLEGVGEALAPVFAGEEILKLGFDTKGDLKALRPLVSSPSTRERFMANLLDIQIVARKLLGQDAASPAAPVESPSQAAAELVPVLEVSNEDEHEQELQPTHEAPVELEKGQVEESTATAPQGKNKNKKFKKYHKRSKNGQGGRSKSLGLTDVAERYLGKPLDKRSRMSDWERRPLKQTQIHYAALDAHVLVQIYLRMQETHPADDLNDIVGRCTQKHVQ